MRPGWRRKRSLKKLSFELSDNKTEAPKFRYFLLVSSCTLDLSTDSLIIESSWSLCHCMRETIFYAIKRIQKLAS